MLTHGLFHARTPTFAMSEPSMLLKGYAEYAKKDQLLKLRPIQWNNHVTAYLAFHLKKTYAYQLQLPQLLQLLQFFQPTMTTYDYHVDYYARILHAPGSTMVSWVPCITQQEWKDTHGKTEKNRNVHTTRPHLLIMAPLSSSSKPKLIQEPFMDEPGNTSQKNKLRNYSMPHAILWHTQLDFPCMIYVHVCMYIYNNILIYIIICNIYNIIHIV